MPLHKREITALLREIATLLELKGENPFKTRAYLSGARALEQMEVNWEARVTSGGLRKVKGIGERLAETIETLYQTGHLEFYETLRASIPTGLLTLLEIESLGAKKVNILHEQLGISTVEELISGCQSGRVAALAGFGPKSVERILTNVHKREAYAQRCLGWEAIPIAEALLKDLRAIEAVEQAAYAGSLRRRMETVSNVDVLAASERPQVIVEALTRMDAVASVTARRATKASVRLENGLQVDMRVVEKKFFFTALHHFTGSQTHNIQMQRRAREQGWRLSQWGLTPIHTDVVEAGKTAAAVPSNMTVPNSEEDLFQRLGLDYIPPELREGRGEIAAAASGTLPSLVEEEDIRGVFHVHTTASDGHNTLEEMVEAAEALGWTYLGIADHSKSSVQANGLEAERLIQQVEQIRALNASGKFYTHVFAGTECDILPDGSLDFDNTVLKELDYVVASVHSSFGQSQKSMTARIIRAIEHPYTTIVGHLTGRLLLRREPYKVDAQKVIDAAIACGKVIELNANPRRLDMDWRLWQQAIEKGLKCSINPDAHSTKGLGFYRAGVHAARKGWVTREAVVNTLDLESVTAFLDAMRRNTLQ